MAGGSPSIRIEDDIVDDNWDEGRDYHFNLEVLFDKDLKNLLADLPSISSDGWSFKQVFARGVVFYPDVFGFFKEKEVISYTSFLESYKHFLIIDLDSDPDYVALYVKEDFKK